MTESTTPAVDTPAKPAVVRPPKLTYKLADGTTGPLLKYAFPAKPNKYPVKVNGAVVDAASTSGKGKGYTYLLINNTSFYVPGLLPVDAEVSVDFPEGYKFDDAIAARVSTYKPKAKKADAPKEGEQAAASAQSTEAAGAGGEQAADAAAQAAGTEPAPEVKKAARRAK